ncbi:MAG TPA: UDP-2,3-diacylglucosamine diphosphatase LpxI [Terriglobia bacterium]|nr:UDP-2,3-diacylglucosamine diphosphatase LpxI [Terriglobia bacterium]
MASSSKYGLIAGNGKFPFLVLEAARSQGIDMVVAAIKEETFPEIEQHAKTVHWLSLGQLGKLIKTFKSEGVDHAVMAGQVKHKQIFSSIVPDLKMIQLLASLATKNTDSLIGAVARVLENEGIQLIDSTLFLRPLLPDPGVLTRRAPSEEEKRDLDYGYKIARELGRLDLGQSVAVTDGACIALEAMEGTDAVMERAASLVNGRPLRIVKLAKPNQDLRFDVPVIGPATVRLMARLSVSALAVEAGKTLMIDREELIREADAQGIAIVAVE